MVSFGISTQIWSGHHWAPGESEIHASWIGRTKTWCPKCYIWINSGECRVQELQTYSHLMKPDIVLHQEKPSTHCTSVGSDSGSKDVTERCYRQHIILHGFSRPFHIHHMCSELPPLIREKHTVPLVDLPILVFYGKCQAVSTGPTRRHCAFRPPSWSLLMIVWSETFKPVACWRSFCSSGSTHPVPPCTKEQIPVLMMG